MRATKPSKSELISAVGYLRRSTSRQEKSLDDQRSEIERYAAANGYQIVRWYQDDGISGDATECRHGFLAFHKAACNGRDFDVVIVWDQDRFGRFDSMEAGYWIHPLRKAGVRLVSVNEGIVNWDDFTGRVMYSLKQEGKHQFLRDLSRNVARGQISNAQKGHLCGQAAPYGYDRMLIDESGAHRQRVRNGEKFAKADSWRTTLVSSDDVMKVNTLRWLFQSYAETDSGLRNLAEQLNARGVPGPTGGPWYAASIRAIFANRNYTGTFTWARRRQGKYHNVASGQIRERDRSEAAQSPTGKTLVVDNPREAWIVVEDAHEAIIDKTLFEKVQTKLHDRRREKSGQSYRTHTRKNGDGYLLSGLVICAQCGCKMHGGTIGDGHQYSCSTYARAGKRNPSGCGRNAAQQDMLVDVLVRKLQETVLSSESLDRLRSAVRRQLEKRSVSGPTDALGLRKQIGELDREIDRAAENFLRAPSEVLDLVGKKLTALKRQREHVGDALRGAEAAGKPMDVAGEVDAVVGHLWRLGEEMGNATPARRREVFRLFVDRIELKFGQVKRGNKQVCPLQSGEIYLRTGEGTIFGSVNWGGAR